MISPLAYIHPDAKIGKNVRIDPFAYIEGDVEIGDDSHIFSNAVVMEGSRIGKECKIFPGAVVGAIPQDKKFKGEYSLAILGDRVTVRESATVNRGTEASGKTIVGNDVLIMANAHVAHDCEVGDHVILANSVALAGHVQVHDWAILGGLAAVHQFVRIGAHVMVSGGSLVHNDVPPYITVARDPLKYMGINSTGLKRRGFKPGKIREIHEIYRHLYLKNMNLSQAMEYVEEHFEPTPERNYILEFIRASKRGVVKGII